MTTINELYNFFEAHHKNSNESYYLYNWSDTVGNEIKCIMSNYCCMWYDSKYYEWVIQEVIEFSDTSVGMLYCLEPGEIIKRYNASRVWEAVEFFMNENSKKVIHQAIQNYIDPT